MQNTLTRMQASLKIRSCEKAVEKAQFDLRSDRTLEYIKPYIRKRIKKLLAEELHYKVQLKNQRNTEIPVWAE